jgi:xylulose-5-phosphate/fructose-6-phosphate phosphoketolase
MYHFDVSIASAVRDGLAEPGEHPQLNGPLDGRQLELMQRYWQAANYLTIGQIYLQGNPLLREPL